MQALYNFIAGTLNTVAWIYILLPCVFVGGLYYTIGSGGIQFRRFGYAAARGGSFPGGAAGIPSPGTSPVRRHNPAPPNRLIKTA